MFWRICFSVAICFGILQSEVKAQSFPEGFRRNPYGVAGSPWTVSALDMPKTSTYYDWIPHDHARYITVRPYSPPRGGTAANDAANPYFWNLEAKSIGRNESDRNKFRNYVLRNRGEIWIIGNEPERVSQDNLNPTQYAQMFHSYYVTVNDLDPTARFSIASVGMVANYVAFADVQPYYDAVFSEYKRLYLTPLPLDYWNMHAYYAGWTTEHAAQPDHMVDDVFRVIIDPYIAYARTVDSGRYSSKPIIASEIGLGLPENNSLGLSQAKAMEFVRLYTRRLADKEAQGIVESFFWFYGGWIDHCQATYECLFQSDWKTPSQTGVVYAQEARAWDRQFGLEQADFNLDRKIGILDFSGLVKVFGTSNALLSLDSDPKISLSDLTIFKQVFGLANQ